MPASKTRKHKRRMQRLRNAIAEPTLVRKHDGEIVRVQSYGRSQLSQVESKQHTKGCYQPSSKLGSQSKAHRQPSPFFKGGSTRQIKNRYKWQD